MPEPDEVFLAKLRADLNARVGRQSENFGRVENLISIHKELYGKGRGRRKVPESDVLRAAVVLLHASLEDFLRTLAAARLPAAGEDVLNDIPLATNSPDGARKVTFSLGKLAHFRGKSVDELIAKSVEQYLERSNYNNTREIAVLLTSIGVNPDDVNSTFPELQKLMLRRHQIVHRADRLEGRARSRRSRFLRLQSKNG
jgi:hypothetical protein